MSSTQDFEARTDLPVSAGEAFAWHERPGAFERLMPPWESMRLLSRKGGLEAGAELRIELGFGPLRLVWHAVHEAAETGRRFVDVQKSGPFAFWRHEHVFDETGEAGCRLSDRIAYRLPLGALGRLFGGALVRRNLERTFRYRQDLTRRDLALHRRYAGPKLRVAVVGASGLLGRALSALLRSGGHEVLEIGRSSETLRFDVETGLDRPEALEGFDALVHLAGENVAAGRWTKKRKAAIRSSRVDGTRALIDSLRRLKNPPRRFVCASAIGFYGESRDEALDENAPSGKSFLAEACRAWEAEADRAADFGARVVKLRFGVIVSPRGGALAKMLPPFRFGLGGRLGRGDQVMSWVSIDDAAASVLHALRHDDLVGAVNVTAPRAVTNQEWTRALGRTLGRRTIFPVPAFAARAVFGEMADAMLLSSQRVAPTRLLESGFEFGDQDLESCFRRLLGRVESGSDR